MTAFKLCSRTVKNPTFSLFCCLSRIRGAHSEGATGSARFQGVLGTWGGGMFLWEKIKLCIQP